MVISSTEFKWQGNFVLIIYLSICINVRVERSDKLHESSQGWCMQLLLDRLKGKIGAIVWIFSEESDNSKYKPEDSLLNLISPYQRSLFELCFVFLSAFLYWLCARSLFFVVISQCKRFYDLYLRLNTQFFCVFPKQTKGEGCWIKICISQTIHWPKNVKGRGGGAACFI